MRLRHIDDANYFTSRAGERVTCLVAELLVDHARSGPRSIPAGGANVYGAVGFRIVHRIFTTSVASVYQLYRSKVERKGRTEAELREVIRWMTGFDDEVLDEHLRSGTTFEGFFDAATLHPTAASITGSICGVRIEAIDDPLMKKIRILDKLVDELAKGRPIAKILRS